MSSMRYVHEMLTINNQAHDADKWMDKAADFFTRMEIACDRYFQIELSVDGQTVTAKSANDLEAIRSLALRLPECQIMHYCGRYTYDDIAFMDSDSFREGAWFFRSLATDVTTPGVEYKGLSFSEYGLQPLLTYWDGNCPKTADDLWSKDLSIVDSIASWGSDMLMIDAKHAQTADKLVRQQLDDLFVGIASMDAVDPHAFVGSEHYQDITEYSHDQNITLNGKEDLHQLMSALRQAAKLLESVNGEFAVNCWLTPKTSDEFALLHISSQEYDVQMEATLF